MADIEPLNPVDAQAPVAPEIQQAAPVVQEVQQAPGTQEVQPAPVTTAPEIQKGSPDQIGVVVDTYRRELMELAEGLRQRSLGMKEEGQRLIADTSASIEPIKKDIISTITDTSNISTPPLAIVQTFGWASILLLGASFASIFGAYVFSPIYGIFIGRTGAAVVAAIGIPIYGYYMVKKAETTSVSDSEARFGLLNLALVQGLLSGVVLSETYVSAEPLAFLFPATIACIYPYVQTSFGVNRISLLSSSIGAAVALNLLAGFFSGSLTTTYLLLTIAYSAASAITMQLVYRNVSSGEQRVHLYQLALLASFVAIKLSVFGLMGGAKEDFEDVKH